MGNAKLKSFAFQVALCLPLIRILEFFGWPHDRLADIRMQAIFENTE